MQRLVGRMNGNQTPYAGDIKVLIFFPDLLLLAHTNLSHQAALFLGREVGIRKAPDEVSSPFQGHGYHGFRTGFPRAVGPFYGLVL